MRPRVRLAAALLAVALLAIECRQHPHPGGMMVDGVALADRCPDDPDATFFPVHSFLVQGGGEREDMSYRRWFSETLRAMGEPSLWCGHSPSTEVYRLTWLRSFHDQISIRVWRDGSMYRLHAVVVSLNEELQPTAITRTTTLRIDRAEWDEVTSTYEALSFAQNPPGSMVWFDGSTWIFEARVNGRFQVVQHHSGDVPMPSVAIRLMDRAGVTPPDDEIY